MLIATLINIFIMLVIILIWIRLIILRFVMFLTCWCSAICFDVSEPSSWHTFSSDHVCSFHLLGRILVERMVVYYLGSVWIFIMVVSWGFVVVLSRLIIHLSWCVKLLIVYYILRLYILLLIRFLIVMRVMMVLVILEILVIFINWLSICIYLTVFRRKILIFKMFIRRVVYYIVILEVIPLIINNVIFIFVRSWSWRVCFSHQSSHSIFSLALGYIYRFIFAIFCYTLIASIYMLRAQPFFIPCLIAQSETHTA